MPPGPGPGKARRVWRGSDAGKAERRSSGRAYWPATPSGARRVRSVGLGTGLGTSSNARHRNPEDHEEAKVQGPLRVVGPPEGRAESQICVDAGSFSPDLPTSGVPSSFWFFFFFFEASPFYPLFPPRSPFSSNSPSHRWLHRTVVAVLTTFMAPQSSIVWLTSPLLIGP